MRDYRVFLEGHETDEHGEAVAKFNMDLKATDEAHVKTMMARTHGYWNLALIVEIF